jgi:dihydrodipicolinate synthase/N-acetylneuraminate lyase
MTVEGILPALVTPYDQDGALDCGTTAALVQALNAQGMDGYFVAGSSGEYPLLTTIARERLLAAVAAAAADRTVIAHVAAGDLRETLHLARSAADAGATAVAANIPTYFHYSDDSLRRYFRELRERTSLPLFAYVIPERTGRPLSAEFLLELAHEGTLQGMKYTATDLSVMAEVLADRPQGFSVLAGSEQTLVASLALGADGGIGASFSVLPGLFAELYSAFRAGRIAEATALQHRAAPALTELFQGEFIGSLKSALRTRGYAVGQARAPFAPCSEEEDARLSVRLEQISGLDRWLLPELLPA